MNMTIFEKKLKLNRVSPSLRSCYSGVTLSSWAICSLQSVTSVAHVIWILLSEHMHTHRLFKEPYFTLHSVSCVKFNVNDMSVFHWIIASLTGLATANPVNHFSLLYKKLVRVFWIRLWLSGSSTNGHLRHCLWMPLNEHTTVTRNKACDVTSLVLTKDIQYGLEKWSV